MLITCSSCQSMIRVPDDAAGKRGKCPKCGTVMTIAAANEPAPPIDLPLPPTGYASTVPPPLPAAPPPVPKAAARYDDYDEEPSRRYEDDDMDIRRPARRRAGSAGMSITSMVLGIGGLLLVVIALVGSVFLTAAAGPQGCCWSFLGGYAALAVSGITGVLAIIFGMIGLGQGGRGFAWTGITTGILTIVVVLVCLLLTFLGFIAVIGIGAAAVQQQQQLQMQQGGFPPPR